jgi:hypothetical protein
MFASKKDAEMGSKRQASPAARSSVLTVRSRKP